MLKTDMLESRMNQVIIPDYDSKVIRELLRFVYTGEVENIEDVAVDLIMAADKYQIDDLMAHCVKILSKKLAADNVVDLLLLADKLTNDELYQSCVDMIFVWVSRFMFLMKVSASFPF